MRLRVLLAGVAVSMVAAVPAFGFAITPPHNDCREVLLPGPTTFPGNWDAVSNSGAPFPGPWNGVFHSNDDSAITGVRCPA